MCATYIVLQLLKSLEETQFKASVRRKVRPAFFPAFLSGWFVLKFEASLVRDIGEDQGQGRIQTKRRPIAFCRFNSFLWMVKTPTYMATLNHC